MHALFAIEIYVTQLHVQNDMNSSISGYFMVSGIWKILYVASYIVTDCV